MTADYAQPFGRVTISGTMFNGAESWSTGFQIGFADNPISDLDNVAGQIGIAWQTFFTTASVGISNVYKTVQVKVAEIGVTGVTNEENIDYYTYPTPISGGAAGQALPPQITLAATMTTERQRGLASKGRMYLPGINTAIDGTTGKLSSTTTNNINTGFKTFLDAINADTGIPGLVIVASKGHKLGTLDPNGQPNYADGINSVVTGCRVGDVYDTQRRRRNDFVETYNAKVLA